jgi:hypothetical protein
LLLVHPPSTASLRHWQADRPGLEHPVRLGLKEGSCGFAKQGTSCLADVSHGSFRLYFSLSYFSKHPSKYAPSGQYSGDISSSKIELWEASSDSHREEKAQLEKCPLHVRQLVITNVDVWRFIYPRKETGPDRGLLRQNTAGFLHGELH